MTLQLAIPESRIVGLISRQLRHLFEFEASVDGPQLDNASAMALCSIAVCFAPCRNKYYHRDGVPFFDPMHTGQNAIFLYFLSRHLAIAGAISLADKVYYLNKTLNALDLYHGVHMPAVFYLDHPVGSVIGRATIGDGFVFCQNCTVGNSQGIFPVIGREVTLFAGATLIGRCRVGERVIFGAGTLVVDQDVPSYSVVSGRSPNLVIRKLTRESFERRSYFESSLLTY